MKVRPNGGIVGPLNLSTSASASGVWSLMEAQQRIGAGSSFWPTDAIAYDPYFSYVTALLKFDGANNDNNNTIADSALSPITITRNGLAAPGSFSPFPVASLTPYTTASTGGSIYFGGSSTLDYLSITATSKVNFGTGDFTIEFWAYPTVNARQDWIDISDGTGNRLIVYYTGTSIVYYSNSAARITASAPTFNVWSHIAVVRISGVTKLYVNGVSTGTGNPYTDAYSYPSQPVNIGKDSAGSTYVTGYMSNIRFVAGVGVYTGDFTVPTAPLATSQGSGTNIASVTANQTTLLIKGIDAGLYDSKAKVNIIPVTTSVALSSTQAKSGTTSFYTSGAWQARTSPIQAIGTGDFTIEFWMYATPTLPANYRILSQGATGVGEFLIIGYTAGGMDFAEATTGRVSIPSASITANAWTHIAFTRTSGVYQSFVNGVWKAQGAAVSSYNFSSTNGYQIGFNPNTPSQALTGYIDEIRITAGYSRYQGTSTFVPPASATAF